MPISAGVAYIDVLPNMGKFGPAVATQAKGAGSALSTFGKTGALAVAAVGVASVVAAADFEKSMRNVNSIAQLPEPAFDRLNEKVLALAGPTAQAPKTLADGLYDLVSSGFDARESMTILESSAKAATAGLTTTDVATKGVAAVLNAYRLPASKAALVSDQLFKTVDQGVITFEELSTGIGDTLPFAASLGVGLDQIGAATATMTKQGLSGSETFTRIRNLLQTMIKPGDELAKTMKDMGYESGEALVKEKGLQGALEAVIGTTDGTKDSVAKLFPNIRALGGALALTGENAGAARKDLEGMKDATGATDKAFEEQQKSFSVQLQKLKSQLTVLAIEIGSALLPVLNEIAQFLNQYLLPAFEAIKSVVGPPLEYINDKVSILKWVLISAFAPFALMAAGIMGLKKAAEIAFPAIKTAAVAVFNWLRGAWGSIKSAASAVWNAIKTAGRAAFSVLKTAASIFFSYIKAITTPLRAWFVVAFGVIKAAGRLAWAVIKTAAGVAFDFIKAATAPLRATVSAAFQAIKAVATTVFNAVKSVAIAVFNGIKSAMGPVRSVASTVFGAMGDVINTVIGIIRDAIEVVQDLIDTVGGALDTVGDLASKVGDLPGKALDLIPGVQHGGPVSKGSPYIVGEVGPELFVPSTAGRVIPNNRLAALGPGGSAAAITITNWHEGTGYIRTVSEGSIAAHRLHDRQRRRMGG